MALFHSFLWLSSIPLYICTMSWGFSCGSAGKESACSEGDLDSIPGLGRSPGGVPGASTGDATHDKVIWRDLMGKASQVSRGPLPEHLP